MWWRWGEPQLSGGTKLNTSLLRVPCRWWWQSAHTVERKIIFQVFRKVVLVARQARANQVMDAGKTKGLHLKHGIVCAPTFGHAIGGDHHSSAIVAEAAMDKHFLVWVVVHQLQEFCEDFVVRKRTMPRQRDILHSKFVNLFRLGALITAIGTGVHHDVDAHFLQLFESFVIGLPAARKHRRYLAKVVDPFNLALLAVDPGGGSLRYGAVSVLRLGRAAGDRGCGQQKYRNRRPLLRS